MRTTLMVDDDVLEAARAYAKARRISLGLAVSELARRGLNRPVTGYEKNGIFVVHLPDGTPPVSDEDVARLLNEFP